MDIVKNIGPPTGLKRWFFRLPIHFYHWHLGWIFGGRMMLLHHIGRKSGKPREVVLEVVHHDPADGSYIVASGWGPTAAWYRNLQQNPEVTIQVGRRTIPVTAAFVPQQDGAEIFARYAVEHRRAAEKLLPRLMGYKVDGSQADFRAVGERIPFVRFVPRG
ncbi:nitroreductase family deazaflavin-dependent oxidoreductase [Nocardia otitidiscaviarum]|uniref:nitroreductase family deazaflavin-dependent oxidoreductase n=1 Tax=Nocardia otitidiscaviarum TaxID=1823 RepID=UPI0018963AA1|nr:nitroreductase family deazaflavin-dependent oxidoreductase [Nocardia otitidiscaviarum]MBF6239102.1 nitroreductase family deazaflavin-dependent oxidoreductase [Nocardia otitidiscaviarum]